MQPTQKTIDKKEQIDIVSCIELTTEIRRPLL